MTGYDRRGTKFILGGGGGRGEMPMLRCKGLTMYGSVHSCFHCVTSTIPSRVRRGLAR